MENIISSLRPNYKITYNSCINSKKPEGPGAKLQNYIVFCVYDLYTDTQ